MTNIHQDSAYAPLYWDDLEVGYRYSTKGRTITEADLVQFGSLTGDQNGLHSDAEYAAASLHGQRIAQGMLVASYVAGLASRSVPNQLMEPALLGVLENNLKFPKATYIGDTLTVHIEVVGRRPTRRPDRGVTEFLRQAVNQRGEVVCEFRSALLVQRRCVGERHD